MSASRHFLFLQGPPGPFFRQLAMALAAAGHRCTRINLNGGDRRDWGTAATDYRGSAADWPAFIAARLAEPGITDLVLFGDCREAHLTAMAEARALGVAIHVFEEGYVRPDWVTLERGGVNGRSSLPRGPGEYLRLATGLPPVPAFAPVPSSFRVRAGEAVRYFFAAWREAEGFGDLQTHRPHSSAAEAWGWMLRFARAPLARIRSRLAQRRLGATPFFVLPLQLDSDHQIRTHSPYADMGVAIAQVVASFAAHAPAGSMLAVKLHPLDNGLRDWRRLVQMQAARHGVRRRVVFLEHADLDTLVRRARGVVTVNSTSGTLALAQGRPVRVLGQAVYDVPGITDQKPLDTFWADPAPPQSEIFEAFRRVLVARCLLRGGFSSVAGRALLVPAAAARLVEAGAEGVEPLSAGERG